MTDIAINDISPRIQYEADGATTEFSYPFVIFEDSDLLVYLNDTLQTSGYTVSGAGVEGGGDVTFDTEPEDGVIVTLVRLVPEERTTDFAEGGAFRAAVINDELDRIVCMVQQLREDVSRSVARPATSTATASLALPDPAAGKALKWNAAGDGLANSAVDPDTLGSAASAAVAAAAAAETAQGLAEDARDAASGYSDDAQDYAAQAAAAVAALPQATITDISVDTTVDAEDNGVTFAATTTAADVDLTCPPSEEAATGEVDAPFLFWASCSGDNSLFLVPQGTDTIAGSADPYELVDGEKARVVLDESVTPHNWAVMVFGAAAGDATPVGAIMGFSMSTVPTGWLECSGAAVSRTTYADLFAAIGTTYGAGDGSTTFNLPDLRGEFLRGWDHGRGVDAGRGPGSFQDGEVEEHDHITPIYDTGIGYPSAGVSPATGVAPSGNRSSTVTKTSATGGAETRPRNVAVMYCIKAFNGVTNQAMVDFGDLASDVAALTLRVAALEA